MATKTRETSEKAARYSRPLCKISEDDGVVRLNLEMPGVTKEGLSVNVESDRLIITGRRSLDDEAGKYLLRERSRYDFQSSYTLDETVDRNRIEASLANGVLTVSLHLKEEVKPRRIQVKGT